MQRLENRLYFQKINNNMISCNLKGGIGNQLFQISTTHALALENNDIAVFDFEKCYTPMQGFKATKYKDNIFKNIKTTQNFIHDTIYTEHKHSYNKIPYSHNILLDGYFQSELYFKNKILNLYDLSYKIEEINQFLNNIPRPIISMHIRRGDYLPYSHIVNILNNEYYNNAIKFFDDSYSFLCVSDDKNYIKENFCDIKNLYFSPFDDELIELILMSMCDHNIISNSTFGWWGAYLNKNENKKVIAPKKWFTNDALKIDDMDIVPESWIKI